MLYLSCIDIGLCEEVGVFPLFLLAVGAHDMRNRRGNGVSNKGGGRKPR